MTCAGWVCWPIETTCRMLQIPHDNIVILKTSVHLHCRTSCWAGSEGPACRKSITRIIVTRPRKSSYAFQQRHLLLTGTVQTFAERSQGSARQRQVTSWPFTNWMSCLYVKIETPELISRPAESVDLLILNHQSGSGWSQLKQCSLENGICFDTVSDFTWNIYSCQSKHFLSCGFWR